MSFALSHTCKNKDIEVNVVLVLEIDEEVGASYELTTYNMESYLLT